MKKKFSETKVGAFLKDKAPGIVDAVGSVFPPAKLLGALIENHKDLSPEDKAQALELMKLDLEEEKEISVRWAADMASDSWLSKNVRPLVLMYCWLLITLLCLAAFFKVLVPDGYVSLIETLAVAVNVAYFGSRGIEKYQTIKKR
mgnify:CR=1 FL=1